MKLNDLPPELLQLIIAFLSPASTLAVALTSRVLFEITIEHLWEAPRMLGLVTVGDRADPRLFRGREGRCGWVGRKVRRAVGLERGEEKQRVPLVVLRARRFEFYASFVRSLSLDETQGDTLSLEVVNKPLQLVGLSSLPIALPRLHELSVHASRASFLKSACSLPWSLCPSLSRIKISVQQAPRVQDNEDPWPSALKDTLAHLPRLDELELIRHHWRGGEDALFDLLSTRFGATLRNLTVLGLDFDMRVLEQPLPALQELNLMLDTDAHVPAVLSMHALRKLHLHPITRMDGSQAVLAALDAPELGKVGLAVGFLSALDPLPDEIDSASPDPLHALLSLLARRWPHLVSFFLHISGTHHPAFQSEAAASWPLSRLRPLLTLSQLKEIHLVTPAQLPLGDADVASLAEAWPEVRVLHLRGGVVERAAGWRALSVLAQLPNLQELALPIILRTPSSPLALISASGVDTLSMGQGDVAFPDHSSSGLRALFPKLKTLQFDTRPGNSHADEIQRAGRLMRLRIALGSEPEKNRGERREMKVVNPWERSEGRIGARESAEVGWPR
ncbi:hypothetical protein CALVIDRAFT_564098 [Calocera viscosa TUFC12733]|uniref:F-box domain-containing protein n=1 Tax=Calocera viscosa (strain TUFC12733) TaxID=1330018 RepID=A0A167M0P0_CALVF|nr:hypothetical protein CALVIDRAFT_564098 [Calocera viscosa TUFC12733]